MKALPIETVSKQLAHFGCTPREASIYVTCLRRGPSTVQEIAKDLQSHRVTIHSAVEQLLKKGLLSEGRRARRRLIVAEPPEVLFRLLEQRESELRLAKAGLRNVVSFLSETGSQFRGSPALRFYRGIDGLKQMLEETLGSKGEVLVVTDIAKFLSLLSEEYLRDYYSRRAALGISARLLWPKTPVVRKLAPHLARYRMKVRNLRKTFAWEVGLFSWNDSLAIMSLSSDQVTCTILESREISLFYRGVVFETLWNAGAPLADV